MALLYWLLASIKNHTTNIIAEIVGIDGLESNELKSHRPGTIPGQHLGKIIFTQAAEQAALYPVPSLAERGGAYVRDL